LRNNLHSQPITVAIDGGGVMMYKGGIFNGSCSVKTNHAVLLVGYGQYGRQMFWKLKNSWATRWGEGGYFRMARTDSFGPGMCGIATQMAYASM